MPLSDSQQEALVDLALQVRGKAYAPYSSFAVGAAILSSSGSTYLGCNVENASYGLTICAERAAVCAMLAGGARSIAAIVIASKGAAFPCGACRQVLAEFGKDCEVVLVDSDSGTIRERKSLAVLLPAAFGSDSMDR